MFKNNATKFGKIKINGFDWFVPHYTPSFTQLAILSEQISSKVPSELQYVERFVFMKQVNTQIFWTFELGTQEEINLPLWIFVGFQQKYRQDSQSCFNDTFSRLPATSTHCTIGTKIYPDSAILLNYDDNDYSQGYGQIKEDFRVLTKDNIPNPYISDHDQII